MITPFRYCGSKRRYLNLYPGPPEGSNRLVDAFTGSATVACYLHSTTGLKTTAYEINRNVFSVLEFLKNTNESRIREINEFWESKRKELRSNHKKEDIRLYSKYGFSEAELNYLRVNVSSGVVGQLSSFVAYPQHSLPFQNTIDSLETLKKIDFIHGDFFDFENDDKDCFVFLDPPYKNTNAGYIEKSSSNKSKDFSKEFDYDKLKNWLMNTKSKWLFTYGDGCMEQFPDFKWIKIATRKVPNLRKGGTVDRGEYYCCNYI